VDDVNTQPNILLVLADQLAAQALPAYGNRVARAPRLSRLAEDGVVFERALCASPLCVPSRASLMTGLLPSRTGAVDNAGELPAGVPTFAHCLRLRGYRTVLVGKMHFIGPDQVHGFEERPMTDVYPAGFDWVPDWELADDERLPWYHDLRSVLRAGPVRSTLQLEYDAEVVERSCRAIAAHDPSRPLLLVASFTHPHDPYEAPNAYWDRYEGVEIDPPANPGPSSDSPTRRLRAMVGASRVAVSPEQTLLARRGYYAALSLVDDHVGLVLDALAERGLAGDTIVVVSSDHGDMRGERGLWYKMAPFEGSIRVPLIVHCPRRFGARRVPGPVSLLDVAPTLVELGGGAPPPELDGVSLAASLAGDNAPARDVPLEYLAEGVRAPQVTLVRGPLKLIRSLGEPDLVYDVEADPAERSDLGGEPSLGEAADRWWDLERLDREVRTSQRRRRLVARALATGKIAKWDHPEGARRYIDTGDDFWTTIERARVP
jgi:choline-sulfatase